MNNEQRGVALLIVLMLLALMAALAADMTLSFHSQLQRTRQVNHHLQRQYDIELAEKLALASLTQDVKDNDRQTTLQQYWAQPQQLQLEDGNTVKWQLRDAQHCFNLNALAKISDDPLASPDFPAQVFSALLINAARGTVVDIPALCDALATKHLAGAAIDVFPTEPATNSDPFTSPLCDFDNVILTPHIGGSTLEAQENIGLEVAGKLTKYSDNGSTLSAVNFPEVSLPLHGGRRLMHIHENRPGVLTALNQIFAEQGVNIAAQYLQTSAQVGYVVIDIEADEDVAEKALLAMKALPGTIRARLLY